MKSIVLEIFRWGIGGSDFDLFHPGGKNTVEGRRLLYWESEIDLGDSDVKGRRSIPVRIGKDVFAVKPLPGNRNAGYNSGHLLNAKRGYGSDHVVRGLAERAIGM